MVEPELQCSGNFVHRFFVLCKVRGIDGSGKYVVWHVSGVSGCPGDGFTRSNFIKAVGLIEVVHTFDTLESNISIRERNVNVKSFKTFGLE